MSMPYDLVRCQKCQMQWPTHVTWGYFEYELSPDRTLSVDRTVGWCHACEGFEAIEVLPERTSLIRKIETLGDAVAAIRAEKRDRANRGLLGWIQDKRLGISRENLTTQLSRKNGEMRETEDALLWGEKRKSANCCLTCGSTHVEHIELGPCSDFRKQVTHRIEFRHPKCGGEMFLRGSGVSLAKSFHLRRIYDPEGRFIRESPILK